MNFLNPQISSSKCWQIDLLTKFWINRNILHFFEAFHNRWNNAGYISGSDEKLIVIFWDKNILLSISCFKMKMTNVGCLNFWLENNNLIVCKPHVLERKNMYFVSQSHVSRQEQAKKMIYSCLLYLISIRIHIWIYSYSYSYHHLQPSLSLIYSNRYLRLYLVRSFQKNSRICLVLWVRWSEKKFEQVAKVGLRAIYNSHN